MENQSDSFRDRLLSHLPQPASLADYRRDVASMLEQNEKRIRRERVVVTAFWIFCAVSAALHMWFDPKSAQTPKGPFLALFIFTWGLAELLKHRINASRIDLLKEIKQVQVQVLELHDMTRKGEAK